MNLEHEQVLPGLPVRGFLKLGEEPIERSFVAIVSCRAQYRIDHISVQTVLILQPLLSQLRSLLSQVAVAALRSDETDKAATQQSVIFRLTRLWNPTEIMCSCLEIL